MSRETLYKNQACTIEDGQIIPAGTTFINGETGSAITLLAPQQGPVQITSRNHGGMANSK